MKHFFLSLLCALGLTLVSAQAERKSLLDSEPDVVYLEKHTKKLPAFLVDAKCPVYVSKKGKQSRKLGSFQPGSRVTLLALSEHGYKVTGKGKNGKLTGWVSPARLAAEDEKVKEMLKQFYVRQMAVAELIKKKQVAIGMTVDEVQQSLGEPTKKETRVSKEGRSGKWEFITYEEHKEYSYVRDPQTGQVFKRLNQVTTQEKEKIEVEFENDLVTVITAKEDKGPGKVKIVSPPCVWVW